MTAMNIVHMRVKPGREEEFLSINQDFENQALVGMRHFRIVKTGERSYCVVGEWDSMDAVANARPAMIASLDRMRPILEDLGGGRGVTEPWSGDVVLALDPRSAAANSP